MKSSALTFCLCLHSWLRGWYVYLLAFRNVSQGGQTNTTEYTTAPPGVNGEGLSSQSLAYYTCMECVSTHQSHFRGSLHTCTVTQNKMHPTDKLNQTPRGGLCLEDCLCMFECAYLCVSLSTMSWQNVQTTIIVVKTSLQKGECLCSSKLGCVTSPYSGIVKRNQDPYEIFFPLN